MNQPLGYLYVLAVPLAAGVATLRGVDLLGFSYTGWMWVCFLGTGLLLVGAEKGRQPDLRIPFPFRLWMMLFGLVWMSLAWCEAPRGKAVQDAVQISMPLVVAGAAAMFVASEAQLEALLRCFRIALWPIAACVAAVLAGAAPVVVAVRALSITTVLIACVFLAEFPERRWKPWLGWAVCLAIAVATGSRMAAGTTLLLPVFHPLVRGWHWRAVLVLVLLVASVALFYTPMLQQRFFHSGSGGLADLTGDDMQTSGRFAAWPLIYERAWRHPLLGAGVGSISAFVPTVWTDMTHAHNDYLRIGFELGLLGLGVFLAVLVWQARDLRRQMARSRGPARAAFAAAWLGFAGFLVLAVSDNPLIYNVWYMNPLFALLGAAYGTAVADAPPAPASDAVPVPLGRPRHRLSPET